VAIAFEALSLDVNAKELSTSFDLSDVLVAKRAAAGLPEMRLSIY
jgi:hypothetical protein